MFHAAFAQPLRGGRQSLQPILWITRFSYIAADFISQSPVQPLHFVNCGQKNVACHSSKQQMLPTLKPSAPAALGKFRVEEKRVLIIDS